ncbi:MAG: hypothetical protein DBY04_08015 [Clostridiales bacterium]|nr:MAG: hypothetical protein DBY04_08015 [Clostridiales bacterium]
MFFFFPQRKRTKKKPRDHSENRKRIYTRLCICICFLFWLYAFFNKRGNNRLTVSAKKSRRGCGFRRISYCGQDTAAKQGLKEDLYRLGLFSMLFLHFNAM